ncbi:hypothetical protein L596_010538 [Steinernema carpocapsae]|uniref:Insulin-like domain-containing protein n=1 Tax=Steinernema carpocapsae TaxID=34508 RepID=A0A4V6A711_STECR|nr:hypothetical protein L596_010538 [Steinernema carpocapsae]
MTFATTIFVCSLALLLLPTYATAKVHDNGVEHRKCGSSLMRFIERTCPDGIIEMTRHKSRQILIHCCEKGACNRRYIQENLCV